MLSLVEQIILTMVVLATIVVFFIPVIKRIWIIASCQYENRFDSLLRRLFYTFFRVILQLCTLRNERIWTGLAHIMIFYGALAFDTMTINHVLEGYVDGFYLFGSSGFGLVFSALVDAFAITVLAGVCFFAFKRFVLKPRAYSTSSLDSALIYTFIFLVTVTYLYYEAILVASHPGEARWAWLSQFIVSKLGLASLSPAALGLNLKISYWLHTLAVFSFIAYVPHSKYFHMFAGPVNLFFRKNEPPATIKPFDLETAETFGAEKATDFTWKDALDSFSCVECGRCQDVCPAFSSGKALSPKMIIYNLEKHYLASFMAIKKRKREELKRLVPEVFSEEEIWACTTCGACLHVCPFEIEHPKKLIDLRQNLVLAEGKFPAELRDFFHHLETQANPWGLSAGSRIDWAKGLNIKTAADNPSASYLLWTGCFGAYDEQGKKIARAMAAILQAASVDFAILGNEEKCCGDSARRLGNEYLFQTLAADNLKTLARYRIRNIITFCPHGYNTLKNEYPALIDISGIFNKEEKEFLKSMRVISHLELLASLLAEKKLPLKKDESRTDPGQAYTYHDACYYGRHNGLFDEPRQVVRAVLGGEAKELQNSMEHSFCCGAGGGLMWQEEKRDQRVSYLRAREIIKSGGNLVVTSCPFCLNMLQDGLRDEGADNIKVMDVAQIVAASLDITELKDQS
ncbi:MAG TPA: heterodisulfide reductase-related iron-sulfur binding cluster [Candidatus Saccharicenans sp.]|nr:heterodisulfide reductase-related iron-sulfur binding cluster [Candidatus Saccharicenans sp.]HRV06485.1 heterodisulfide reductase-related iron-sulfur binding cluster [Candidatus Saccharicenans sp.]